MRPLYKTTIVIWSDFNPERTEIHALAHEAVSGDCYCSTRHDELVPDPSLDPEWDNNDFFAELDSDGEFDG